MHLIIFVRLYFALKSLHHVYCAMHFCYTDPVTPLKCISPRSVGAQVSQCLAFVSPTTSLSVSTTEHVTIPASFNSWKLHSTEMKTVAYRLLDNGIPDDCPPVFITHILSFTDRWQLWVHGKSVELTPSPSTSCDSSSLAKILEHIEARHLCEGVADPSFLDVVDVALHNAFMDEVPTVNRDGVLFMRTCRVVDCELLISPPLIRCQPCMKLRERL